MERHPYVTVKLVLRCQGRVLVIEYIGGGYDFPGGRMHFGESLFEALSRELKEEIGWGLPKNPKPINIYNYIAKERNRHSVVINYFLDIPKKPDLHSPEGMGILWLTKKEFLEKSLGKKVARNIEFIENIFKESPVFS